MPVECIRVKGPKNQPDLRVMDNAGPKPDATRPVVMVDPPPATAPEVPSPTPPDTLSSEFVSEYEICDNLRRVGGNRLSRKCPGERGMQPNTGALNMSSICRFLGKTPGCNGIGKVGKTALRNGTILRVRAQNESFRSTEIHLRKRQEYEDARLQAQCKRRFEECNRR